MTKIKSIVVDTFTAFQKNEILEKWEKGKAQLDDWKDYGTDIVLFARRINDLGFNCVAVLGYEGSGKSFGMKTLVPGTNLWYNADNKNPTWLGGKQEYGTKTQPTKYMVIPKTYDDVINHIKLLKSKDMFDENPIAFFLAHIEDYKSANGQQRQRLKTFGKLANKVNVEDMFNVCYYTDVRREGDKVNFQLRTQNNGWDTCRSNEGMHTTAYIPNDYKLIIDAIENY